MNKAAFFWALGVTIASLGLPLAAGIHWPPSAPIFLIVWPYLAALCFSLALGRRFLRWASTPAAFNIPISAGALKGGLKLPAQPSRNPPSPAWVWIRLIIEALTFRTLWANLKYRPEARFRPDCLLAAGAFIFHWSLGVILAEHLRFFWNAPPFWLTALIRIDSGWLPIRLSTAGLALGWLILCFRRLASARLRMISRFEDWLALGWLLNLLLSGLALALSGGFDLTAAQRLLHGLSHFQPAIPQGADQPLFMAHFFQAGLLLIYLPSNKLSHGLALFLNPTLAQANNSRQVRHLNPRLPQTPLRTYVDYEADNRADLLEAGLPLEHQENHDQTGTR